jgi:hypothetical protein
MPKSKNKKEKVVIIPRPKPSRTTKSFWRRLFNI